MARDFKGFEKPSGALRMPWGVKIFLGQIFIFGDTSKHFPEGVVGGGPQPPKLGKKIYFF